VKKLVVDYNQDRARWSRVTRGNVADATRRAYDGLPIGQYRENDKLYPILLRHVDSERANLANQLSALQVLPTGATDAVPLGQVTDNSNVQWEDQIIWRFNRRRTITVQASPPDGVPASRLRDSVLTEFEQLESELPPGYELEWGGEYESSRDAQLSLIPGIVPAAVIVALIIVGLFNAFRPPLIIMFVIPFAIIGVTVGLLLTGNPFGFLALLGTMSLVGMMIKNAIVLLDQINIEIADGKTQYDAVMDAAVSRLRPVVLAAATTVLGVIPLLQDVFWVAMAVTIMFGLAFGTVLTMILLPVLYATFFKLKPPN
jgi:multidrug efflux pump subunit AcrB